MKKASENGVTRGQTISFRIPSDTPDYLLKQLQRLKETERRNFSSKIAEFVMNGVSQPYTREREMVTFPLPKQLTKAQRDWLKHEHSEALLGSIVYQLISDPVRATSLLASLNSRSLDIDEALYLQDEVFTGKDFAETAAVNEEAENVDENELLSSLSFEDINDIEDDDLSAFSWKNAKKQEEKIERGENITDEKDADDILGDFLANMNK